VQHPIVIDPDGEPEPDLAVVVGDPRAYVEAHPRSAALVVEVAGSSLAYDRGEKARLYARADLPEYWIVNLADGLVEVHREPAPSGYGRVTRLSREAEVGPLAVPHASIKIADLLP
jgi:Uma2 family endonuclease